MRFTDYLKTRNHMYTGRGSTAIYLALLANQIREAQVLVPANICYAAVLSIVYSGNEPVFADVGEDGNLTSATVAAVRGTNLKAAIIPHMYGNPCRQIADICQALCTRGMVLIEDCALAMGADVDGVMVGTFGDYAIYSFGYSKTIDCGYGGLIVSQRNLDDITEMNAALPCYTPSVDTELQLLSQIYRVLRNNASGILTETIYECMQQRFRHCFIFRATTEQITRLSASLNRLETIIYERREKAKHYDRYLNWGAGLRKYTLHEGAVPWRYNILVKEAQRPDLVAELLRQRLAVSDWYPVIAPMFRVNEPFPQAQRMERQLLNFPLVNVTMDEIQHNAQAINQFFETA